VEFIRRNRILLASAALLVVAAALVVQNGRTPARNDHLGRFFLEVMAPLQRSATAVENTITGSWRGVADLVHARSENAALREQARQLHRELDRLAEVDLENARLRKLLDFRDTLVGDVLTARVIGRDATGLARTLTIGRGEADGVTRGAAVLAPEGVVGQVFLVSAHAARVLLVSDHNSGVDALVQRTRARGIVQGTIDGGCALKYVKRTEDVQVGDELVASGLDGIFPKGLAVGRVTAIDKRGQGLFQSAEVAPRVDFDQLEEVLVTRGPVTPAEPQATPPAAPGG
jgi:rod shape-determining protein MreC